MNIPALYIQLFAFFLAAHILQRGLGSLYQLIPDKHRSLVSKAGEAITGAMMILAGLGFALASWSTAIDALT